MKTILVTGAAGYIGRHVVKKALDMGAIMAVPAHDSRDYAFARHFGLFL